MSLLTLTCSFKQSRHTQRASCPTVRTALGHLIWSKGLFLRFTARLLRLDFSVSLLDWIFGPGAAELQSHLLPLLCLLTPLLQLLAGGRDCWPTMFLALVVTPELREFLARARGGAGRLIKVCIQDGEWPRTVELSKMGISWPSVDGR